MRKKPGPKYTQFKPEIIQSILSDIEQYVPYKIACLAQKVHESTFHKWLKQGADDILNNINSDHASIVESLNKIKSKRIKELTSKVVKGKHGHKGSEWILERVFWKNFSSGAQNKELIEKLEKIEEILKFKDKEQGK